MKANKYVSGGLAVVASVVFLGAGTANAVNEYKGQTYERAAQSISNGGGSVVIATREGSYLPTEKCMVVGSRTSNFLDSSGRRSGGYTVLLDLNCNDTTALNGHPGNSAATPEGQKAVQARRTAVMLSKNYESLTAKGLEPGCGKDDNTFNWCQRICKETEACSAELNEYLGL